jgi:hypothetical protein
LAAFPVAPAQHEIPKARHVARREEHVVGEVHRARRISHLPLRGSIEVLHANRTREVALERVVDVATGFDAT